VDVTEQLADRVRCLVGATMLAGTPVERFVRCHEVGGVPNMRQTIMVPEKGLFSAHWSLIHSAPGVPAC